MIFGLSKSLVQKRPKPWGDWSFAFSHQPQQARCEQQVDWIVVAVDGTSADEDPSLKQGFTRADDHPKPKSTEPML